MNFVVRRISKVDENYDFQEASDGFKTTCSETSPRLKRYACGIGGRRKRRRGNTDTRETSVSADSSDGFNRLAIVNKIFRDVII